MLTEETPKIQKSSAPHGNDYHLWCLRCKIARKGKGYWSKLQAKDCDQDIKDKSSAITVVALDDSVFCMCSTNVGELVVMVDVLDKRLALNRIAT